MNRRELAVLVGIALVALLAGYVLGRALEVAFLGLPVSVRRDP